MAAFSLHRQKSEGLRESVGFERESSKKFPSSAQNLDANLHMHKI
jgi:hypothetical protein